MKYIEQNCPDDPGRKYKQYNKKMSNRQMRRQARRNPDDDQNLTKKRYRGYSR